jgi:hypothetical protein
MTTSPLGKMRRELGILVIYGGGILPEGKLARKRFGSLAGQHG